MSSDVISRRGHAAICRALFDSYYGDPERLERAVQTAVDGTVEAFRRRERGEIGEEGQQQESVEAILGALDEVPPDQPAELVKRKVRLRIDKLFG